MNTSSWNAFRAMFWKECREMLPWASLSGVALAGYLLYEARTHWGILGVAFWDGVSLTFFFAARAVALLLGMVQILPELRRDRWAFLMHRPGSRFALFAGKAAAGLALYALALGLPLLGAALWARSPGNLAGPFDWGQTWVSVTQIIAGVVLYFGAMLSALRPARWYGGRLIPLLAAFAAGLAPQGEDSVALVFWANIPVGLILMLAAWGSFANREEPRRQHWAARGSLNIAMYLGMAALCICLFLIGQSGTSQTNWDSTRYTKYQLAFDGRIVRAAYRGSHLERMTEMEPGGPERYYPDEGVTTTALVSPWLEATDPRDNNPQYSVEMLMRTGTAHYGMVEWYYLRSRRQIVGYSESTRAPIGVLGPQGFIPGALSFGNVFPANLRRTDNVRIGDFADSHGKTTQLDRYLFGSEIYVIDWSNITIQHVFSTGGEPIVNASVVSANTPYGTRCYLVSTKTRFLLVTVPGQTIFTIPREHSSPLYSQVELSVTQAGRWFLWYIPNSTSLVSHAPTYVTELSQDGRVLKRVVLPPLSAEAIGGYEDSRFAGLVTPVFAALGAAIVIHAMTLHGDAGAIAQWNDLSDHASTWIAFGGISAITALCCGVLAALVARRCGLSVKRQLTWAITYALLGLPGLLTLLALRPWPARATCPNCRKPRVVTREFCEHCGAEFSPTLLDGTEIFEGPNLILHTEAA